MKKILTGIGALVLATNVAHADVSGDVRYWQTQDPDGRLLELELNYDFGKENGVDMYTWIDGFIKPKEYFGETSATTRKSLDLGNFNFKARGQITHNSYDAGMFSEFGLGVQTNLPLPDNSSVAVTLAYTPLWLDNKGNSFDRHRLDWFFITTKKLPLDAVIKGYGDVDYQDGNWQIPFSQVGVMVPLFDKLFVGGGINFFGNGNMSPKANYYGELQYGFTF